MPAQSCNACPIQCCGTQENMEDENPDVPTEQLPMNVEDGERNRHHLFLCRLSVVLVLNEIDKLEPTLKPAAKTILAVWLVNCVCILGVGIYGINYCPYEPFIPLFLIATGIIGLVTRLLHYYKGRFCNIVDPSLLKIILYAEEIVLLAHGTYWVYKRSKPKYDAINSIYYCDKTVYLYAFFYINIVYTIIIVTVVGFFCFLLYLNFFKFAQASTQQAAYRQRQL